MTCLEAEDDVISSLFFKIQFPCTQRQEKWKAITAAPWQLDQT